MAGGVSPEDLEMTTTTDYQFITRYRVVTKHSATIRQNIIKWLNNILYCLVFNCKRLNYSTPVNIV